MKTKINGLNSVVVHKNTVYEKWKDDNGAQFYFPINEISEEEPVVRWEGGKVPWQTWVNICAFCELVSEKESSECQVQLFYNEQEKVFCAWAFPQQKKSGMVTKELNEHPDFIKQLHKIRKKGFYPFGTLHTHDKMGAFQSPTDHKDEKESEGLHITLGKISKTKPYDIHARFTAKKPGYQDEEGNAVAPEYCMLPVEWTDFIQPPDFIVADRIPFSLKKKILEELFLRPDVSSAEKDVVDLWMKNRIEDSKELFPFGSKGENFYGRDWCKKYNRRFNKHKQEIFPGWEGSSLGYHRSFNEIESDYYQCGKVNDPDVNEEYFCSLQDQNESINDTKVNIKTLIREVTCFCEKKDISANHLYELLIDGEKCEENVDVLNFIQSELDDLIVDLETEQKQTISYADIIDALELIIQGEEKLMQSKKRKNDIVKRKKLKHIVSAK